jgi:diaminopimelate epimerase
MVDSECDSDLRAVAGSSILGFCKMQGLGNDFVVVGQDELESVLGKADASDGSAALSLLAQQLCSRRFGIGADGFIVVRPGSKPETLSWTYLNSDGSTSLMCGNGLRCLALWAVAFGKAPGKRFFVETGKGPVEISYDSASSITTDLGAPILDPATVPVNLSAGVLSSAFIEAGDNTPIVEQLFQLKTENLKLSCVSMGNPHCVIFEDKFDDPTLEKRATELQTHPFFPEGVNVEFVQVVSNNHIKVVVYERGCGRTLACASGAGAVLVASSLAGRTGREADVELEGGTLRVSWSESDNHVRICGPAKIVYNGQVDLHALKPEAK